MGSNQGIRTFDRLSYVTENCRKIESKLKHSQNLLRLINQKHKRKTFEKYHYHIQTSYQGMQFSRPKVNMISCDCAIGTFKNEKCCCFSSFKTSLRISIFNACFFDRTTMGRPETKHLKVLNAMFMHSSVALETNN